MTARGRWSAAGPQLWPTRSCPAARVCHAAEKLATNASRHHPQRPPSRSIGKGTGIAFAPLLDWTSHRIICVTQNALTESTFFESFRVSIRHFSSTFAKPDEVLCLLASRSLRLRRVSRRVQCVAANNEHLPVDGRFDTSLT